MQIINWYHHSLKENSIICIRKVQPLVDHFDFPTDNLVTESCAYVVIEDIPILITKLTDFEEYNELSWLHKEEIGILAGMSRCAPGIGCYSLYGGHEPIYFSDESTVSYDFRDTKIMNDLLTIVRNKLGVLEKS